MDNEKKPKVASDLASALQATEDIEDVEWGENNQERMVDHSERHGSLRHICKGRGCDDRFEKL